MAFLPTLEGREPGILPMIQWQFSSQIRTGLDMSTRTNSVETIEFSEKLFIASYIYIYTYVDIRMYTYTYIYV